MEFRFKFMNWLALFDSDIALRVAQTDAQTEEQIASANDEASEHMKRTLYSILSQLCRGRSLKIVMNVVGQDGLL
eukprot:3681114-Alexandrium_andersonii.AAC.1